MIDINLIFSNKNARSNIYLLLVFFSSMFYFIYPYLDKISYFIENNQDLYSSIISSMVALYVGILSLFIPVTLSSINNISQKLNLDSLSIALMEYIKPYNYIIEVLGLMLLTLFLSYFSSYYSACFIFIVIIFILSICRFYQ